MISVQGTLNPNPGTLNPKPLNPKPLNPIIQCPSLSEAGTPGWGFGAKV